MITHILKSTVISIHLLLSIQNAYADEKTQSIAMGGSNTFAPIGFIVTEDTKEENGEGHISTATHIGNGVLVTAAHHFLEFLRNQPTKVGPAVIDLTKYKDKYFFWSNILDSETETSEAQEYKAVKVVVDGRYIQALATGGGGDDPTEQERKYDIAFVKLERVPPVGAIPLVDTIQKIPDYGILVGYGIAASGKKHALSQTIAPEDPLQGWGILVSDVDRHDLVDYISKVPMRKQSCDQIMGRQCTNNDYISFEATEGDSGGPLLVNAGGIKIIGIMTNFSEIFEEASEYSYEDGHFEPEEESIEDPIITKNVNEYISIVSGARGSFTMNPEILALMKAAG